MDEDYHDMTAPGTETIVGDGNSSSNGTTAYNGFAHVESPDDYLNAPKTINIDSGPYSMDIANPSYYDLSPMLNVHDPVSLHFLVQASIAESKGYKVLSQQEFDEAKKECTVLSSRISDISHKLMMERKLQSAASSLSKLHFDGSGGTNNSSSSSSTHSGSTGSSGRTRSFLFSSHKKRLSKHAEEELELANRKIQTFEEELAKLNERLNGIELKLLKHHVGLLSLTHQGSQSSSAKTYETHLSRSSTHGSNNTRAATSRMMNQRNSRSSSTNHQHQPSCSDETLPGNSCTVDSLITLVSSSLASPTTSPRPPPPNEKMSFLANLSQSLVSQYDSCRAQLSVKEAQCDELTDILHTTLQELDSEKEVDSSDLSNLRSQALETVSNAKRQQQREEKNIDNNSNNSRSIPSASELDLPADDDGSKVKALMRQQLESLSSSYEANRIELERLELENVELKANLRDSKFNSHAEIQELQHELKANQERVQEWQERCETLRNELESVVKTLEDLTRQTVEYESDRTKLESKVQELQSQLDKSSQDTFDKRVSVLGMDNTTTEKRSVTMLRCEFKKIIAELNTKHQSEIKKEQVEKKKLENLLRSIKTSSYAANLPPGKLDEIEAL